MNRDDFRDLAELRIAEAECLFRNGLFDGAYYLAGYAVESGLKACIAMRTNPGDFPPRNAQRDCYTHDLEVLLKTAGLDTILADERKQNDRLDVKWKLVKAWKEESRYDARGTRTEARASEFLEAITDPIDGVLTWIKRRW